MLALLEHLIRQTVSIQVDEREQPFREGLPVTEIPSDIEVCDDQIFVRYTNRDGSTSVVTESPRRAKCGGISRKLLICLAEPNNESAEG